MKQCPNCGYNVPDSELFCAHCGMRVSFSIEDYENKANLRSIYVFLREQDYENFKNKIWYENRNIYNKLDWYGSSGAYGYDKCWVVKLYDDLTAVELEWTVDRIREFHGQYYQH